MAKTCPSCGYNPIGPFIDNCPMCAEPVRHVRSGNRGFAAPPNRHLRWVIVAVLFVVLVAAGYWVFQGRSRRPAVNDIERAMERAKAETEAGRRSRTVVVRAADLLNDFQKNPDADSKYKGMYLEIFGFVEKVGMDGDDTPFAILHGGDENSSLKIECFFDTAAKEDEARVGRLRKSQNITIRGEYNGRVSNIQLRECVIVR